jgi:threonine dehydrogenase-like Zn-dependent dehydrogenase
LPEGIDPKAAVFLANMETAVNLVQDASPGLGDRVAVLGQGIVGLLVSSVLSKFPLASLYAVESIDRRRALSAQTGVHDTFSPFVENDITALKQALKQQEPRGGADVILELTGSPAALNLAVDLCAYSGRIVVGSWYGTKRAEINLGERFHRNRMVLVSSQVSTIAPELSGRWDKARRFAVAWDMIKKCQPAQLISHCLPFAQADAAYRLLDDSPQDATQVIFEY